MTGTMNEAARKAAEQGVHAVTPHLICAGAADAIEFYKRAFGATELMRMPGPGGAIMHACISLNGSSVFLVDENIGCGMRSPKALGGSPVGIHLIVEDADAAQAKAAAAGAKVTMPVAEQFWGDRYGVVEDPWGHRWSLATPGKPRSREEIEAAMKEMFAAQG